MKEGIGSVHERTGDLLAYLYMWTTTFIVKPGSVTILSLIFSQYFLSSFMTGKEESLCLFIYPCVQIVNRRMKWLNYQLYLSFVRSQRLMIFENSYYLFIYFSNSHSYELIQCIDCQSCQYYFCYFQGSNDLGNNYSWSCSYWTRFLTLF